MSLKFFHILFIVASVVLTAFVGGWGLLDYRRTDNSTNLMVGAGSLLFGLVLTVYGNWFLKKIRRIKSL